MKKRLTRVEAKKQQQKELRNSKLSNLGKKGIAMFAGGILSCCTVFSLISQIEPEEDNRLTHKFTEETLATAISGNVDKSKFCDIMVVVGESYNDRFSSKSNDHSDSHEFTKEDCMKIAKPPVKKGM